MIIIILFIQNIDTEGHRDTCTDTTGVIDKMNALHEFVAQQLHDTRRRIKDRPRDPAMWNEIADVVSALSIPVIANGDVFEYGHFERIKSVTVMVARGALWNASIFRAEGKSSWEDIKREYMRKCILWDNDVKSTKHTLKEMIMHYSCLEFDEGKAVTKSKTIADLANFYGEDEYYQLVTKSR